MEKDTRVELTEERVREIVREELCKDAEAKEAIRSLLFPSGPNALGYSPPPESVEGTLPEVQEQGNLESY